MFAAWSRFVGDYRRARHATDLYKKGKRLCYADRFVEAVAALRDAIALIGDPQPASPFFFGWLYTLRLEATTLFAYAAAKAGDDTLTMPAIRHASKILAEARIHISQQLARHRYHVEWERWAEAYLASDDGQK